ncbi:hypothetical protein Nepgr_022428 [Nepenthes gracilis]|uniref:Uncharacterized protein n=1 Tax=Nepenthes gracilis TaxID=150966 RepID=A0AAD3T0X0_NEPGR|nr:hypothetical protein Nepgr_022428 [Nepenthes gracilis]
MEGYPGDYSPSLKQRLKQTLCCCFRNHHQGGSAAGHLTPGLRRSSSQWASSRSQEFPEFKEKCGSLIGRMCSRRRSHSTDFRYDPLSYALNFDEGEDIRETDEFPLRNFSARLPQSPATPSPQPPGPAPDAVATPIPRKITAYS